MILSLKCFMFLTLMIFVNIVINKYLARYARNYFYNDKGVAKNIYYQFFYKKKYLSTIMIAFVIFVLALINGHALIKSLIYSIFSVAIIIMYKKIRRSSIKKQVLSDLLNVTDCLRVQLSSGISLEIALKNLPELCKNKEFSDLLTNLYLEYELDKFTIGNYGTELERRFNYSEIKMFISAIRQQNQHTSMIELVDNLIEMLRERYIEFLEDATKSKMAIMTLGVFVIVINIAMLGVYPVLVESFNAINMMFY